jgi:aspartate/methionine/tyrosine aminotransferase
MRLFETPPAIRGSSLASELVGLPGLADAGEPPGMAPGFSPSVDERMLDLYARAGDPADALELRDLWLGRVECGSGGDILRPELAQRWRASRPRRVISEEEVLNSAATVRFVKELFNWFFRNDVYGDLRDQVAVILSSGSVDEGAWGLPPTLKQCIAYAADRDWYGYSDSRGRIPAREAVARYENASTDSAPYQAANVALTLGGTFAISSIADFMLTGARTSSPTLCGIPNYPPLVASIGRRCPSRLVPLPCAAGTTSVEPLIAALTPDTPLVMVQTVANPTGAAISEPDLERLIMAAAPSTMILLDECHDWLGPSRPRSRLRAAPNVVRVTSLSKTWSAPGIKVGWILADVSFIESYYEYASTSYGGPPSFFYTFVEVLARMERWVSSGLEEPGSAELAEFEPGYGLQPATLAAAYRSYRTDRIARERELIAVRDAAVAGLVGAGARVIGPRCSINVAAEIPGWDDSYVCFRDLLRLSGVSVFPGVLLFCPAGAVVRITTARRWADLSLAIARLRPVLDSVRVRHG